MASGIYAARSGVRFQGQRRMSDRRTLEALAAVSQARTARRSTNAAQMQSTPMSPAKGSKLAVAGRLCVSDELASEDAAGALGAGAVDCGAGSLAVSFDATSGVVSSAEASGCAALAGLLGSTTAGSSAGCMSGALGATFAAMLGCDRG